MNHTPVLLHDHNEFLKAEIFLKGIDIYVKLIESVANSWFIVGGKQLNVMKALHIGHKYIFKANTNGISN